MRIPVREMEAREAEKKSGGSKLFIALGIIALLGGGAFLFYPKLFPPGPEVPDPPKADPKKADPKAGNAKSKEPAKDPGKKTNEPKLVLEPKEKPHADPAKDPAGTSKQKDYEVTFTTSPPAAAIIVDSDPALTCKSPCSLKLSKARHGVQATLPGFIPMLRGINVPETTAVALTMPEATGILAVITTPPGATIVLNGQPRPEKSPARFTLREGQYTVEVVSGANRDSQDVTIKQGSSQTANFRLQ